MHRPTLLVVIFIVLAALAGCNGKKSFGQYSTSELEEVIAERLKFIKVSLTNKGDGVFTGTGTKATGEVYDLKITRSDHTLKWEYTYKDANGKLRSQGSGEMTKNKRAADAEPGAASDRGHQ